MTPTTKRLTDGRSFGSTAMSSDRPESDKADQRKQARILKAVSAAKKDAEALAVSLGTLEELVATGQSSTNAIRIEWVAKWERKTGDPYLGNIAEDAKTIRRLRNALSDEDLRARIDLYLDDEDPFVRRNVWNLATFARQIARYGKAGRTVASRRGAQTSDADLFERDIAKRGGR